jgi:hypothetical protein
MIPLGVPIDQRVDPESLGESLQLSKRSRSFSKVDEMRFDAAFCEES